MKSVLKWSGIAFGGLLGLVAAAIVILVVAPVKLNRTYELSLDAVAIPGGEAALARANI